MGKGARKAWRTMLLRALVASFVACVLWAFFVEPYRLEVTHHRIRGRVLTPLRIAHVSDLHTGGFGMRERALVEALRREQPDVMLLTGDVVDDGNLEHVRPLLDAFRPPLGTFAVEGNWEHWRPVSAPDAFYRSASAMLLRNDPFRLRRDVWLVGLDDALAGDSDAKTAFRGVLPEAAVVAMFHSPIAYDAVASRVDLALAGHTHGGQVRVPFFGAPWLPPGSGRYVAGWYDKLYVSRGVGTSLARVRFACRPELAIIDLVP